jgi:hypothetical protein
MSSLQDGFRKMKETEMSLSAQTKEKFQHVELLANESKFKTDSLAK